MTTKYADPDGRYLNLIGRLENIEVTIASCYVPNTRQLRFCRKFCELLSQHARGAILILRDFNMVFDPVMVRSRPTVACFNQPQAHPFSLGEPSIQWLGTFHTTAMSIDHTPGFIWHYLISGPSPQKDRHTSNDTVRSVPSFHCVEHRS